jgi:hypothetical protein
MINNGSFLPSKKKNNGSFLVQKNNNGSLYPRSNRNFKKILIISYTFHLKIMVNIQQGKISEQFSNIPLLNIYHILISISTYQVMYGEDVRNLHMKLS